MTPTKRKNQDAVLSLDSAYWTRGGSFGRYWQGHLCAYVIHWDTVGTQQRKELIKYASAAAKGMTNIQIWLIEAMEIFEVERPYVRMSLYHY